MNTEATHDQNEALTTGARLRNAREQLGLSQQAVAERLCLKVSTVRDIEEDKAPADLASTFLRGYIRSYARLVHIPEEELLPEDAVLCELLLSAPFEALLEPDEAVEEDVVPEEAPEELPDDAPEDPVLPDEPEDELDELELPEAAGAPATVTSSVLLVTVQSL